MAEPLKNQYDADVPRAIAAMISAVHPSFNSMGFVSDVTDSLDQAHGRDPSQSLASFLYLPHTLFVAEYGPLAAFELLKG